MNLFLATFVVRGRESDTEAINAAVGMLDFIPIIRARNMHVFLVRSEKSRSQLEALLAECLDPADYSYVVEHPAPCDVAESLEEALAWIRRLS